jgi:N-acetylmuramoyl-L-alanine amidase
VTWQEIVEAGYTLGDRALYLRYPMVRGDDVRSLQAALNLLGFDVGKEDGIFGSRTDRAAREFQAGVGLPVDGIVGPTTVESFLRLRSGASAGGPGSAAVREREGIRGLTPNQLRGATIALDAGHGGEAPGAIGPTGLQEARVAFALVEALAREIDARGARPLLLRGYHDAPTDSERARSANDARASLVIAIHMNSNPEPGAEGATVFYCGREDWASPSGHRLAELIMDELTALGLTDGRTHPKWLPLLRETRMPAVHVEPCFITNPHEEDALRDDGFRRRIAAAIARGVERYFDGIEPQVLTVPSTEAARG